MHTLVENVAAPLTRTAVRLVNIRKSYSIGGAEVHALDGVSASFERGDFWAILGASGSGKSTLLNLLGCLDRPTSGSYFLAGQDVSQMDDDDLSDYRLKHLGFIFQSFNLVPQLTVLQNIQLPLEYQGWEDAPARLRATELASRVGLQHRLEHKPLELSGGQQQRVAIARSLANDPAMILADEPTGNLDSRTSREIMEFLSELNRQGKTIVMVTHEPDIAAFARQRLFMKDGRIERVEKK